MLKIRLRPAALTVALATALIASVSTPATADTSPTSIELLQKCDKGADSCVFHVSGAPDVFWSATEVVGQTANCTDVAQSASIAWSKSTFSSNSVGVSFKFIAGATKALLAGYKIAYQHEWTETTTDSDSTAMNIPPGFIGRVRHARQMERVKGQYELHFGKRFYGHYYWYVPFTVTSPRAGGNNDNVSTKSTPMTAQERSAYC